MPRQKILDYRYVRGAPSTSSSGGGPSGVSSFNGRTGDVVPTNGDYTPTQIGAEPSINTGTLSQYWRGDKNWTDLATDVRSAILTGLSTATNAVITATDSVLSALGKLQAQISSTIASLSSHVGNTSNPHNVTKAQVGLGNVDNTSDINKPVSTAQAASDASNVPLDGSRTMSGTLSIQASTSLQVSMGVAHPTIAVGPIQSGALDGNLVNESISYSDTVSFGCRHNFYRARGTAASPNNVVSGDTLGALQFFSRAGGTWQNSAAVYAEVDGTPGATFTPARLYFFTNDGSSGWTYRWNIRAAGHFEPMFDGVYNAGSAASRINVVYAATSAINTSDAREKTAVGPLATAELAAAADLARAIGTYQWLSMVAEKGAEGARHHAGLTVQRAIEIMWSHGLDPMHYGFICYDRWDETPEVVSTWPAQDAVLDDDGNVITPAVEAGSEITQAYRAAGDRYSFRTDELLLFIARGFAARLDALEAKI